MRRRDAGFDNALDLCSKLALDVLDSHPAAHQQFYQIGERARQPAMLINER